MSLNRYPVRKVTFGRVVPAGRSGAPDCTAGLPIRGESGSFEPRGIHPIGVLGVLMEAKGRGLLAEIRPALDDLRDKAGLRVGLALYARVLRGSGE